MSDSRNAVSRQIHRLVDFVVLGVTFYASCTILSVELEGGLFFHMLAYSTVLFGFVRLSKRAITSCFTSVGESTRQILGNAIGILIGAHTMLLLEGSTLNLSDIAVVIILSGVMAFFVLGTSSPFMHTSSLEDKKSYASLKRRSYKSYISP